MSMKNPLTLAGIEPATIRFVAQHLNHCATAVPEYIYIFIYLFLISGMLCLMDYCFILLLQYSGTNHNNNNNNQMS